MHYSTGQLASALWTLPHLGFTSIELFRLFILYGGYCQIVCLAYIKITRNLSIIALVGTTAVCSKKAVVSFIILPTSQYLRLCASIEYVLINSTVTDVAYSGGVITPLPVHEILKTRMRFCLYPRGC